MQRAYSEPLCMTSIRNLDFMQLAEVRSLMDLPWTPIWGWPCTDGPLDAPEEIPAGSHVSVEFPDVIMASFIYRSPLTMYDDDG